MDNTNYVAKREKVLFGHTLDGVAIYLDLPKWDCNWYWGFGYLGNRDRHYHLKTYQEEGGFCGKHRNISMFDAFKADYKLCPTLAEDNNLWKFCELVTTVYALLEVAEIFNRGGSHMTANPCRKLLKSPEQYQHINNVLLPALFTEIDKIFGL
jgi:hypothetical protein